MNQTKMPATKARPLRKNAAPIMPGVLDEPEDLERNHRQHARHQVQNEPAEETEEQELSRGSRLATRAVAAGAVAGAASMPSCHALRSAPSAVWPKTTTPAMRIELVASSVSIGMRNVTPSGVALGRRMTDDHLLVRRQRVKLDDGMIGERAALHAQLSTRRACARPLRVRDIAVRPRLRQRAPVTREQLFVRRRG